MYLEIEIRDDERNISNSRICHSCRSIHVCSSHLVVVSGTSLVVTWVVVEEVLLLFQRPCMAKNRMLDMYTFGRNKYTRCAHIFTGKEPLSHLALVLVSGSTVVVIVVASVVDTTGETIGEGVGTFVGAGVDTPPVTNRYNPSL